MRNTNENISRSEVKNHYRNKTYALFQHLSRNMNFGRLYTVALGTQNDWSNQTTILLPEVQDAYLEIIHCFMHISIVYRFLSIIQFLFLLNSLLSIQFLPCLESFHKYLCSQMKSFSFFQFEFGFETTNNYIQIIKGRLCHSVWSLLVPLE